MKQLMNISLTLILLQLSFSVATAQTVQDSSMQKMIAGERAFYETLGNIYPAEITVTVGCPLNFKNVSLSEGLGTPLEKTNDMMGPRLSTHKSHRSSLEPARCSSVGRLGLERGAETPPKPSSRLIFFCGTSRLGKMPFLRLFPTKKTQNIS
jgi:hypothetical protein